MKGQLSLKTLTLDTMGLMIKHELLPNQILFLVALLFGYGLYVAEELIWQNIHCYFRMKY